MNDTYTEMEKLIMFMTQRQLEQVSLPDLAKEAGLSPAYVQKLFTKWVGVSPKQFGRYVTLSYARTLLHEGNTLEKTAHAVGMSGTGRLHDLFVDIEAMTPGEYKDGGKNLRIRYWISDTQFGRCLIATTTKGVCTILFADDDVALEADLRARWPQAVLHKEQTGVHATVLRCIHGVTLDTKIKLHVRGTNFQMKVWEALLAIPEGSIVSYGTIATRIGTPSASRAVGTAIGENPIGYLIPCHRVLQATGALGGYRWGTARKQALLEYEAIQKDVL